MKKFFLYCFPAISYAGMIFYVSSVPGKDIPNIFCCQDIVFHFLEYFGFAFFVLRAIKFYQPKREKFFRAILVILICFAYAASDEFHQSFVPGRTASVIDLAVDTAGSVLAVLLL